MTIDATYLLIHGGGSTARFWDRAVPLLDRPAFAIDLPGRNGKPADFGTLSVDDEVASVVRDVEDAKIDGPLVIVAHSSGGLVVPGVVAGLGTRVAGIVLNAALVPVEGGLGIDCMKPRHREGLVASVEAAKQNGTVITLPGPPPDPEAFRNSYGGDPLDDETLAFVLDPVRCVPDTVHHYFQPVRWSQAAPVPVAYVVNERDRPIPTATQEQMLTHLPQQPTVFRLDTGHLPAVTAPEQFAALVATATNAMV
ncbi:MAG TPA: alpha/beta hydrolase [Acidimicrobiia bacterium]|jgi:pimeloyl-ACP methyl ester carboxylesterase|nr:alpha/beta hydrolase [Acidimicrobiia bacterium]